MPVTNAPVLSPSGTRCAFCEHVNPPAAKYCNECASDLQLILCELCSAVNRRGMPQCHKCGGALIEQSTEPPVAAPPVATPSATMTSRPRSIRPLVAVIAVLAAVTIGAFYLVDLPPQLLPIELHSTAPESPSGNEPAAPPVAQAPATDGARTDAPDVPQAAPVTNESAHADAPGVPQAAPPPPPRTEGAGCTNAVAALALCDRSKSNEPK